MGKDQPPPYHSGPTSMPMPMPMPMPTPTTTATVTNVSIGTTGPIHFGPSPQALTCPHCHAQITSTVDSKASTKTHIIALLLCCFLCWPCVCLPYCMESCQNRNHSCPNCGAYLGTYEN